MVVPCYTNTQLHFGRIYSRFFGNRISDCVPVFPDEYKVNTVSAKDV